MCGTVVEWCNEISWQYGPFFFFFFFLSFVADPVGILLFPFNSECLLAPCPSELELTQAQKPLRWVKVGASTVRDEGQGVVEWRG